MRNYLYNLAKFHATTTAIQSLLGLFLLLPSMAEEVRSLWWLAALAGVLSVGPVLLVLRGSVWFETQESVVCGVYYAGQVLLFEWLVSWLPESCLIGCCFAFAGLLVQTVFYESKAVPQDHEALVAAGSVVLVLAAVTESTLMINWAFLDSIALVGSTVVALLYLTLFTSACYHMVEERQTPTRTLAGEAMLLWKYYVAQVRSLIQSH